MACTSPGDRKEAAATPATPGCDSPLGFIPEGGSRPGYLQPVAIGGSRCESGPLVCNNGRWSGAYIFPACSLGDPLPGK